MLFRSEKLEVRINYQRELFSPEIKGVWFLRMPVLSLEQDKKTLKQNKKFILIQIRKVSFIRKHTYIKIINSLFSSVYVCV